MSPAEIKLLNEAIKSQPSDRLQKVAYSALIMLRCHQLMFDQMSVGQLSPNDDNLVRLSNRALELARELSEALELVSRTATVCNKVLTNAEQQSKRAA